MESFVLILNVITGPLLVVGGLWLTVRHFKIARTVSYIERFNHPDMVTIRAAVDAWLKSSEEDDERMEQAKSDPVLNVQILTFMNLFVEVGIAYRCRTLNRSVAFDIWSQLVPEYWQNLQFYVERARSEGRDIANAFERLAGEMQGTGTGSVRAASSRPPTT